MTISNGIKWIQYHDHSKWIYSLDGQYACFGDLNRNTDKQEVRGEPSSASRTAESMARSKESTRPIRAADQLS